MGTAIVIGSLIGTAVVAIAAIFGGRERDPQPALVPVEPQRPRVDPRR